MKNVKYGAGAVWSRLFLPGAGADPVWSEPESAPGPRTCGAAQKVAALQHWLDGLSPEIYIYSPSLYNLSFLFHQRGRLCCGEPAGGVAQPTGLRRPSLLQHCSRFTQLDAWSQWCEIPVPYCRFFPRKYRYIPILVVIFLWLFHSGLFLSVL